MFRTEIVLAIFVLFTAMLDCYSLTIGCSRYLPSYMIIFKMVGAGISIFMLTVSNYLDSRTCGIIGNDLCSLLNMDQTCLFPSYFSYFTVIILIGTSLPICMRYWCKIGLLALTTSIQCFVNEHYLNDLLECSFLRSEPWTNLSQEKYNLCGVLICAAISMGFLSRHMEQVIRVLFLWRSEVEEQRHCAEDLKRRNEALVYNILPPHVAAHFMGNRNRNYDELYSQSYEEVGVLFASMPNFSDFYSEETVNNQGLECLRFLNEVISDFDALLELPQYHDIIKIKTIGSTYMAASGLNPSRQIRPDDPIQVRWAHLSLLVEFALDLKKALQSINEQSFNHFVLKMGINHGPITAGVIGARKPHYDIWGNTVNVASRMESTGKAGCIQVTEETCEILQAFDYRFEHRGLVAVKGKGQLMTYYLQGKSGKITPPTVPASPDILETIQKAKEETPERTEVNYPEEVDDDVFILEIEASELQGKADMTNSNRFHGEPPLLRPLKLL